ncbi:MAG: hypothetical protein IPJ20_18470 [Flammeovirgaceae bacterium]|nr:hypothetical protein [Flammeovirgaceae bacterium]
MIALTGSAGTGNQWYKNGALVAALRDHIKDGSSWTTGSGLYSDLNGMGCASLVSVATGVTINPLPLVTPVVTPATTLVCSGGTVTVDVAGDQDGINCELFNGGTSLSCADSRHRRSDQR